METHSIDIIVINDNLSKDKHFGMVDASYMGMEVYTKGETHSWENGDLSSPLCLSLYNMSSLAIDILFTPLIFLKQTTCSLRACR